jgi:phage terminase large subunit-like protein
LSALLERLKSQGLSSSELRARLNQLSDSDLEELFYDWTVWARSAQVLPQGDWAVWLILAGRGFGKTRVGAETVRIWKRQGYQRINFIAPTADDLRDVMVEGESGILAVCHPSERPVYRVSKRRLEWPDGSISLLFSADKPDRLRGKQADKIWADEPATWRYAQDAWDQAMFGLRLGDNPQAVVTTTPRPIKLIRALVADSRAEGGSTHVTRGTTYENKANLAPGFYSKIITAYEGTRLGRQELMAEILDDNPGALFHLTLIEGARVRKHPPLVRIVVAIDPAVSSREDSDETGIIVAAIDGRDPVHVYILEDLSGIYTPDEWAKAAITAYHRWQADRIVGEVNNGGDLVEANLRTQDANVSYKAVHASRGKAIRAEPVSALYEQGRVHHVGMFSKLEDQMTNWAPAEDKDSPDRMDAEVWAVTELCEGTTGWAAFAKGEAQEAAAAGNLPKMPQPRVLVDGSNKDICGCGSKVWITIAGKQQCFKCGLPRPRDV